jgi:hypothetical protein
MKKFITVGPGPNVIKIFTAVSYVFNNKLERLSLASLSSLAKYFRVRPEPTHSVVPL